MAEALARRDESEAAWAAANCKFSLEQLCQPHHLTEAVTTCSWTQYEEPNMQWQDAHVRQPTEHLLLSRPQSKEMEVSQVHELDSAQMDVRNLLLQSQEQQRLHRIQHEQERLLLQRSCNEFQSEVKALQNALLSSQSELEVLRARVAEAEVLWLPAIITCFLFSCTT